MEVHNNCNKNIDLVKIYNGNKDIFKEVDYLYERYSVDYTITIIKFKEELLKLNFNLKEFLRPSDKYIKLDSKHHLVLFTYCPKELYGQTILALEKKIIKEYDLYQHCVIFNSYSGFKTGNSSAKDILEEVGTLLRANTTDGYFSRCVSQSMKNLGIK